MLFFSGETPFTGLSVLRSCGAQRSMIRDLFKMNVGLDQPRTGEASLGVINLGFASERVLEGDDATLFHPNIDEFA
jgi:hypothetical protein